MLGIRCLVFRGSPVVQRSPASVVMCVVVVAMAAVLAALLGLVPHWRVFDDVPFELMCEALIRHHANVCLANPAHACGMATGHASSTRYLPTCQRSSRCARPHLFLPLLQGAFSPLPALDLFVWFLFCGLFVYCPAPVAGD